MTIVMVKSSFLFLNEVGMTEILLIAMVVLLLFGGKKIPELMKGLGKGMREFNDAKNNVRREIEEGMRDTPPAPQPPAAAPAPAPASTPVATTTSDINLEKNA